MQLSRGLFTPIAILALSACGGAETPAGDGANDGAGEPEAVESPAGDASAETEAPVAEEVVEAGDAAPAAFAQCKACHSTEPGKMMIGPSLAGVAGKQAGSVPGFAYSGAMKASGLTWDAATLDKYLADPKGVVPGTKMAFVGLEDEAKRKEVVDYVLALD